MGKLTVLVPAYNEESTVETTATRLSECAAAVDAFADHEIVVIDDGSEDDTARRLRTVAAENEHIKAVSYPRNRGKGFALRRGFQEATGDFVLFADADPDLDPAQIDAFADTLEAEGADVVVGSKRHPDSDVDYPLKRRILSKGYSALARTLFDVRVRDTQVGLKLFRRQVLEDVFPLVLVKAFAFDIELLALARERGYDIAEAPVSLQFAGSSTIDWPAVARMGWDTLAVFYRQRIIEYYGRVERGEIDPVVPAPSLEIADGGTVITGDHPQSTDVSD